MKKKKLKYIKRDLIYAPLYIAVCTDKKAYIKELIELKIPPNSWPDFISKNKEATTHFFERKDHTIALICIDRKCKIDYLETVLCHETVHIWQEIKVIFGEHNPSYEFEAYSIANLFGRILKACKKLKRR